jgi:hypothetical protein
MFNTFAYAKKSVAVLPVGYGMNKIVSNVIELTYSIGENLWRILGKGGLRGKKFFRDTLFGMAS